MLWAGPECRFRWNCRVGSGKSRRDAGVTPADHSLCHAKKQPASLQCSSPLQKLATWRSSAPARQCEPKALRWRSEMERFPPPCRIHSERNGKLRSLPKLETLSSPQPCLFCFFLLLLLLHRYMKHLVNFQEVPPFTVDVLIIVGSVMMKTEGVNWFCENRDCRRSVTLPLSLREEITPRCICGWPLKRANAPVASTYLEFLHNDESFGKQRQTQKE
jgi:hypothetical protein